MLETVVISLFSVGYWISVHSLDLLFSYFSYLLYLVHLNVVHVTYVCLCRGLTHQIQTWPIMVREMLGNVRTEKNKNEILLKCLKSVIKQSKFFAQEFKSVWSDLFENWYSWKQ